MLPGWRDRIESVQVIKAESMRSTSAKQKEFVIDIAKLHSCSWGRAFSYYDNLRPQEFL